MSESSVQLHPSTIDALNRWIDNPSQALLLIGVSSRALSHLHKGLVKSNSDIRVLRIQKEVGNIGIADIRSLIKLATQKNQDPLYAILQDIDLISLEAQNSLLKTLEEPPLNLHFIMSALNSDSVLSTIKSRATIINVTNLKTDLADDSIKKAEFGYAKSFLAASPDKRLSVITEFTNDKTKLAKLLQSISEVYSHLIYAQSQRNNNPQLELLLKKQITLLELQQDLADNVSPKAVASYLCTGV